jgi:hypothetical protein
VSPRDELRLRPPVDDQTDVQMGKPAVLGVDPDYPGLLRVSIPLIPGPDQYRSQDARAQLRRMKGQRCAVEDCGSAVVRGSRHCSYHRATAVTRHLADYAETDTVKVATLALPRLDWPTLEPEEHEALGQLVARRMASK